VFVDVDAAGETDRNQGQQQGNSHMAYPLVTKSRRAEVCSVSWPAGASFVAAS
jgi:hypothetical protein